MSVSHLEAFDLIAHAEVIEERLATTLIELASDETLVDERSWLEGARRRVATARTSVGDLLERALRLPELEPLRGDRTRAFQATAIEKLEGLQAAIVRAVERSPLVDVIFRELKPPMMVKAKREVFEKFCQDIERRLASTYVARMLADETYASVAPALEVWRQSVGEWRELCGVTPMPEEDAGALRRELEEVANGLEPALRQARLLAEAALVSKPGRLAASGLIDKPKRRAARVGTSLAETG
jgi:hypothetical protein